MRAIRPELGQIVLPQWLPRHRAWITQLHCGRVFHVEGRNLELFTISIMAHALGRATRVLRRWEEERIFPGPMWKVPKTGATERYYSKVQIANLRAVYRAFGKPRKSNPDYYRALWKVFFLLDYTPEALVGDVI